MWLRSDFGISLTGPVGATGVSVWADMSGHGNDASQGIQANTPTYVTGQINGFPVVRFTQTSPNLQLMLYNGSFFIGTNYSIFAVEGRSSSTGVDGTFAASPFNLFLSGSGSTANCQITVGYRDTSTFTLSQLANDLNGAIPSYVGPGAEYRMSSMSMSRSIGKAIWRNDIPIATDVTQTAALLTNANGFIGGRTAFPLYYKGDIAELIFFTYALDNRQRTNVENYLQVRYNLFNNTP